MGWVTNADGGAQVRLAGVLVALLSLAPPVAFAYRPFDQTDSAVAEPQDLEMELGPFAYVRTPGAHLYAPGLVLNYGLVRDCELVLEGRGLVPLQSNGGLDSPRFSDVAFNVKAVLREGVLQGGTGPSVAAEIGLWIPGVRSEEFGGALAVIVTERTPAFTVHVNGQVARSREHRLDLVGGAILEGPYRWPVRPVGEAYWFQEFGGIHVASALVGAIWQVSERLSFDGAVRNYWQNGAHAIEFRLGLTWAVALRRSTRGAGEARHGEAKAACLASGCGFKLTR